MYLKNLELHTNIKHDPKEINLKVPDEEVNVHGADPADLWAYRQVVAAVNREDLR